MSRPKRTGMPTLSPAKLEKLRRLIAQGLEYQFYSWEDWRRLRPYVVELDNCECQLCKAKGRYRPGKIVHHVKHLRQRPDLALSLFDPDTGERQLVLVCKACHEEEHPESQRQYSRQMPAVTEERWD